ncbi:MAG TPA: DUF6152 family protein [Ramlibacter sp.]|uniref:DUF6152 family protein n=1 Tax=Ramlibacter sp. TaxID=1917967 RepID=UPI002D590A72|nr:DUF6152 family protein [Ramlibacter sp.]HZY19239.1 DUF6152 family protein [Ramlibacter sp.]
MKRRNFVLAAAGLPGLAAAHHGWSSFDQDRPIYLEGRATSVRWQNPHAEVKLDLAPDLRLPTDLSGRAVPSQSAPVDGKALLARAQLPRRKDRAWTVELAPLTRMEAWKVPEIKPGTVISVVGFSFKDEQGDPVLRAEYLFVGGQAYGLRSSPA